MSENRAFVDAIFRAWSAFYDNPVQQKLYFGAIQRRVLDHLGERPGRVLDLGCGTGELLTKLREGTGLGLDLSRDMLLQGAKKPGLGGKLVVGDGHHLPFEDGGLDAITCLVSFQYYLRPEVALSDMRRVLKPDGALYLAALTALPFEIEALESLVRERTGGLFRVYAPSSLKRMLHDAGFEDVHYRLVRPLTRLYVARPGASAVRSA